MFSEKQLGIVVVGQIVLVNVLYVIMVCRFVLVCSEKWLVATSSCLLHAAVWQQSHVPCLPMLHSVCRSNPMQSTLETSCAEHNDTRHREANLFRWCHASSPDLASVQTRLPFVHGPRKYTAPALMLKEIRTRHGHRSG